jgi:hypothetical protein
MKESQWKQKTHNYMCTKFHDSRVCSCLEMYLNVRTLTFWRCADQAYHLPYVRRTLPSVPSQLRRLQFCFHTSAAPLELQNVAVWETWSANCKYYGQNDAYIQLKG